MPRFRVVTTEQRLYETAYCVEAPDAERARQHVMNGGGIELEDEFLETIDRTIQEVKPDDGGA